MKRYFALSRSAHGLLDIAMPAFCALLWAGRFPAVPIIALGLATAFAGYTAIYALNDLIDYRIDKKKMQYMRVTQEYSVEPGELSHPIAQNKLSVQLGAIWVMWWASVAMIGAYYLNPVIIIIFLFGAAFEVIYCLLLRVTYWRVLVSGLVKSCGPIAAILTVDPNPSLLFLGLLFLWLLSWEIGGQNIPADLNDIQEDHYVKARTIPVLFGETLAKQAIMVAIMCTMCLSIILPCISPMALGGLYYIGASILGFYLLWWPAWRLYQNHSQYSPARLFDRASYYPFGLLVLLVGMIVMDFLQKTI